MILLQIGFFVCGGIFALIVAIGLLAWAVCAMANVYRRKL